MNENTNKTIKSTGSVPPMVCPVCGMHYFDVHSFAEHMTEHSKDEKKRKAEKEKEELAQRRKKDIEELEKLYEEKSMAEKKLQKAIDAYHDKYGSVLVEYDGTPRSLFLSDLLRSLF